MRVPILLVLSALLATAYADTPTQTLGAFITPVDATASSSQEAAGRTPRKLIDGSGWGETRPGSGVYVHTNDVSSDGNCMWNGDANATLGFDLGKTYRVNGVYVWNYNEGGGWNSRSVKDVQIASSEDGKSFAPVGKFTFAEAPGTEADPGQAVPFRTPVRARYFRFQIVSNYRGGEMSGLAEVRFSNADAKAVRTTPIVWKATYPRPQHPGLALGRRLPGAENVVYPADAGVIDVTKAPYFAKGDGRTDDTAAIQNALDDHPSQGAIVYLPNGVYRVTDTLHWPHGHNPGGEERETVLQGQSRDGTVLQLPDHCPGFDNPRRPKSPINTGFAPA